MKSIGVQSRKEYQIWYCTCWLESNNFHSFIESTHFNEIHQFTIDQFYTTFQIHSFYWVISIEDFRGVREFQIEKYKDSDYQIKSSKQVLLKESVMKWNNSLVRSEWKYIWFLLKFICIYFFKFLFNNY